MDPDGLPPSFFLFCRAPKQLTSTATVIPTWCSSLGPSISPPTRADIKNINTPLIVYAFSNGDGHFSFGPYSTSCNWSQQFDIPFDNTILDYQSVLPHVAPEDVNGDGAADFVFETTSNHKEPYGLVVLYGPHRHHMSGPWLIGRSSPVGRPEFLNVSSNGSDNGVTVQQLTMDADGTIAAKAAALDTPERREMWRSPIGTQWTSPVTVASTSSRRRSTIDH